MTGLELIAECRIRLRDTKLPYLWEDAQILKYLVRAEQIHAELTHCLLDFDTYTVTTVDGQTRYPLVNKVISVLLAQESTQTEPMRRANSAYKTLYTTQTGPPRCYAIIPKKPLELLLSPAADGAYTILLGVATLPTADLTKESDPEIPAEYHLDLTHYAVAHCLMHSDTDGFAPELAQKAEDSWLIALRDAKREIYRKQYSFNVAATPAASWTGGKY